MRPVLPAEELSWQLPATEQSANHPFGQIFACAMQLILLLTRPFIARLEVKQGAMTCEWFNRHESDICDAMEEASQSSSLAWRGSAASLLGFSFSLLTRVRLQLAYEPLRLFWDLHAVSLRLLLLPVVSPSLHLPHSSFSVHQELPVNDGFN